MADLGNKIISSNYQKLLQISSSGEIADGSGSGLGIFAGPRDGSISGSATSTGSFGRINFAGGDFNIVISASATQTASIGHIIASNNSIQLGGRGGTTFNKANIDDLKLGKPLLSGSNGRELKTMQLTATKDADTYLRFTNQDQVDFVVGSKKMLELNQDGGSIYYGESRAGYLNSISPSHIFSGDITASGNISSSGTIYASKFESAGASSQTISFNDNLNITGDITASGHISASGNIYLEDDNAIYFENDDQTYIEADDTDRFRIVVGGSQMMVWDQDDGRAVFGNGTKVYIGNNNNAQPSEALVVQGNISASGTIYAQSDISASGDISASNLYLSGFISASGHISSSGNITAQGNLRSVGDFLSDSNITASKQILTFDDITLKDGWAGGDTLVKIYDSNDDGIISVYQNNSEVIKLSGVDGSITASGDLSITSITASGEIRTYGMAGDTLVKLHNSSDDGVVSVYQNNIEKVRLSGVNGSISASGNLSATGNLKINHITASGNISASGTLYANEIELGSHLYIPDSIVHAADTNTKIRFPGTDTISFHTAGQERFIIDGYGNISASAGITSSRLTTTDNITLKADHILGDTTVKMYNSSDDGIISVYQNNSEVIKLSGVDGSITASGGITVGSGITGSGDLVIDKSIMIGSGRYIGTQTDTDLLKLTTNQLFVAGQISASGGITSSRLTVYDDITLKDGHNLGDTLVKIYDSSNNSTDDGIISVYQNNSEVIRLDGGCGSITASGDILSYKELRLIDGGISGDTLVKISGSSDDGIVSVYQNNSVQSRIHGNGASWIGSKGFGVGRFIEGRFPDTGSNTTLTASLHVSGGFSNIKFENLPTTEKDAANLGTGSLYLSGSTSTGKGKFLCVYTG